MDRVPLLASILILGLLTAIPTFVRVIIPGQAPIVADSEERLGMPRIEIVSPRVSLVDGENEIREFVPGESLTAPLDIRTSVQGSARIIFPRGSILYLDGGSQIKLVEEEHSSREQGLVRLVLVAGRAWSHIENSSRSGTAWEMTTDQVVITGRAGDFDVFTDGKTTRVMSFADGIFVAPKDPKTGLASRRRTAILGKNEALEVSRESLGAIVRGARNFVIHPFSGSPPNDPWLAAHLPATTEGVPSGIE